MSREKKRKILSDSEYEEEDTPKSETEQPFLIDPTLDTPFKKLCFEKKILMSLLNTFLQLRDEHKIVDVQYTSQEELPEIHGFKSLRFDIICTDTKKNTFIVEMQNHSEPGFVQRSIYYWSKVYSSQLKKGQKYTKILPVMLLVFLNFEQYPQITEYINHFRWKNDKNQILTEGARITYVEIPKFKKQTLETIEDEWMFFFKNYKTIGDFETTNEEIKSAFDVLKKLTPQEIDDYDAEVKNSLDLDGIIEEAEEKGREEGREETAIGMIKDDMKPIDIVKYSKLSEEKIKELYFKHSDLSKKEIRRLFKK
jgi:predicted transposase/invertase (TIGR01784 family)